MQRVAKTRVWALTVLAARRVPLCIVSLLRGLCILVLLLLLRLRGAPALRLVLGRLEEGALPGLALRPPAHPPLRRRSAGGAVHVTGGGRVRVGWRFLLLLLLFVAAGEGAVEMAREGGERDILGEGRDY